MATRAQVLIPITIAAFIVGIAGILSIPSDVKFELVEFPRGTIKIDNVVLEVQIADTDLLRTQGLMFQEELPFDQGMLFVFEGEERRSIWMLNMQFSLDILWLDIEGNTLHIEKNVPPCKTALETATCPSYKGDNKLAKYVLEVTSGFVDEYSITENSKLEIVSI
ncbi:MAG: DUF192 domain-containing protein [Nitrosopumilaceae archaeon]